MSTASIKRKYFFKTTLSASKKFGNRHIRAVAINISRMNWLNAPALVLLVHGLALFNCIPLPNKAREKVKGNKPGNRFGLKNAAVSSIFAIMILRILHLFLNCLE